MNSDERGDVPEARLLTAALAQVTDAVCLTDAAGRITFANPAFAALYGYDEKAALGLVISKLGPHETAGDTIHRTRDGREVPVRLTRTAAGSTSDRANAWIYVARDLSEARRKDDALRRAQEELASQRVALQELAVRDELTGLYNHKEMQRLLVEEVGRLRRYRRPLSLLRIHVDDYREVVAAEHGEQAADAVLRSIAGLLRANLRPIDRPARFTGDELAVILPDTYATDAVLVAERLRTIVAAAKTPVLTVAPGGSNKKPMKVTLSIGVAGLNESEGTSEQLIRAAGQALSEARGRGRDCVVTFVDLAVTRD
ncbi:MAG: two-component system, cell cycle response regulator [Myxococcales bacterium]|nr:two-component system, cell cycle response regulator [Myxococcales bacterium]